MASRVNCQQSSVSSTPMAERASANNKERTELIRGTYVLAPLSSLHTEPIFPLNVRTSADRRAAAAVAGASEPSLFLQPRCSSLSPDCALRPAILPRASDLAFHRGPALKPTRHFSLPLSCLFPYLSLSLYVPCAHLPSPENDYVEGHRPESSHCTRQLCGHPFPAFRTGFGLAKSMPTCIARSNYARADFRGYQGNRLRIYRYRHLFPARVRHGTRYMRAWETGRPKGTVALLHSVRRSEGRRKYVLLSCASNGGLRDVTIAQHLAAEEHAPVSLEAIVPASLSIGAARISVESVCALGLCSLSPGERERERESVHVDRTFHIPVFV